MIFGLYRVKLSIYVYIIGNSSFFLVFVHFSNEPGAAK